MNINFSIENDILYSLYAGSLIGFYRTGYMIPWDDDIDLVIRPMDWEKIEYLWNGGINYKITQKGWKRKEIQLNGKTYTILKFQNPRKKWFKIRNFDHKDFNEFLSKFLNTKWNTVEVGP